MKRKFDWASIRMVRKRFAFPLDAILYISLNKFYLNNGLTNDIEINHVT